MASHAGDEEELLIPPENFAMVEPGIYRSGFPGKKNFPFVKALGLRTVIYLCPEDYPDANLAFLTAHNVQVLQFGVAGNKEPNTEIPYDVISEALVCALDTRHHPLLIHCNKGKHRTGCMVGVIRKALGWNLASIFEEYRLFSAPKERFMDQQWIELFQMTLPDEHPIVQRKRRQEEGERRRRNNENEAADEIEEQAADDHFPLLDYSRYLLNPNISKLQPLQRQDSDRDIRTRAPDASNPSAQPPHVLLSARSEKSGLGGSKRPLSHRHHTYSQPNLSAILHNKQT